MKRLLLKYNYPKLAVLIVLIVFAYSLFRIPQVNSFTSSLSASYISIFLAGMLFSFGFTTPFAVGFFLTLNPSNIWLVGIIGGFGALLSDLLIFNIIKFSLADEFNNLKKEYFIEEPEKLLKHTLGKTLMHYFLLALAGFVIASPLPDELGISLLAGLSNLKQYWLAIISLIFNTLGIIIMLSI